MPYVFWQKIIIYIIWWYTEKTGTRLSSLAPVRMMTLYVEVRVDEQPLREILPTNEYRNMSFGELKVLVDLL